MELLSSGVLIDVLIIIALISAMVSGWRQGALTAGLSVVGVVSGLIIGFAFVPVLVNLFTVHNVRLLVTLATIIVFVGLGNMVGATVGARVRENMRTRTGQRWDSAVGAVLQVIVVSVVLWLISMPLAANAPGQFGDGVRNSRVLAKADAAAPGWMRQIPEHFSALLDESGLPPLVSPFQSAKGGNVDAPNPADVDPTMVKRVRPSIVHVVGDAQGCSRRLSGSGFVAAPDYVITNAHVVAGTNSVTLDTVLGVKSASVVLYDPDADLAVLHSPELGLDAVPQTDKALRRGEPAVIMGFPKSGPFVALAARVREKMNISGPDIYATGRIEREAYSLRGNIRQGNSGGPVLNTKGEVVGVVFGAAVDDSETGYALTWDHVKKVIGDYTALKTPVDTQRCVS
ncbi:MarP family serine protease [Corynebacterium aquatimens]|uniref:Serine protease n=1 Tax=Corynebacterium aquatimens TaxID=1190508 RepID=A0A931GU90_9CORY|nr:S1-C subfamily serine protease [Corynebacterium aquatimens]